MRGYAPASDSGTRKLRQFIIPLIEIVRILESLLNDIGNNPTQGESMNFKQTVENKATTPES